MQKYLIDTQILIWSLISPEKLSSQITALLSFNLVYVSQISLLEITIKQKLGKLPELQLSTCDLETIIANGGLTLIPLEVGIFPSTAPFRYLGIIRIRLTGYFLQPLWQKTSRSSLLIATLRYIKIWSK